MGFAYVASRGRWQPAPHLRLVSERVCAHVAGEGTGRLAVMMHPRSGKSELISRYTPPWFLGNFPDKRVAVASYGDRFAASWGRKARNALEEWGQPIFDVRVSDDSSARNDWSIHQREGGMVTAGIGGELTGRGIDLGIIDDPVKDREQADSEVYRDKAWEWYQDVFLTRTHPGAVIIVLLTRWHEDDLLGRILEHAEGEDYDGPEWEVIRIPALAEDDDDPLGREVGEAMWPQRGYDEGWLRRRIAETTPRTWNALYQQRPAAQEGDILKRPWWNYYPPGGDSYERAEHWPQFQEVITSWDMAFKDSDDSSYVVGSVWGRDLHRKFLLRVVRRRMRFTETVKAVVDLRDWVGEVLPNHQTHRILVEDKANGTAVIDTLKSKVAGIIAVEPEGSKEARAEAAAVEVESGCCYLPGFPNGDGTDYDPARTPRETQDFVDECASFPGMYDDQVDSFTQAILRMRKRGGRGRGLRSGEVSTDTSDV